MTTSPLPEGFNLQSSSYDPSPSPRILRTLLGSARDFRRQDLHNPRRRDKLMNAKSAISLDHQVALNCHCCVSGDLSELPHSGTWVFLAAGLEFSNCSPLKVWFLYVLQIFSRRLEKLNLDRSKKTLLVYFCSLFGVRKPTEADLNFYILKVCTCQFLYRLQSRNGWWGTRSASLHFSFNPFTPKSDQFKFLLQTHQQYLYNTQFEELGFS